jgi:hypothetical protein
MTKNRYEKRTGVPLTRLHLDPENPRHDPIADEDKIVAQLYRKEQVLELAKSIAAAGGTSPLETIGVIEMDDHPGHFIVVEGNRRACALKLLRDPKKAPTSAAQNTLTPLSAAAAIPSRFDIVIFGSRETARPWLELRHLGAQKGAGVRPWDNVQKTRFAGEAAPDTMALQVLDRALEAGWIDAAERSKIGTTTITRYLGNPVVRNALGLGNRGALTFTHDVAEVDAALKQFVRDALPRADGKPPLVNSRSKSPDWQDYGRALHDRGLAPKTPLAQPTAPPRPTKAEPKKPRGARHPSDRPTIIPTSFVSRNKNKALVRLIWELRNIDADDFPFGANYLVRAIIEKVMALYATQAGVFRPRMDDRALTRACNDALEKDGVPQSELKNMRIAFSTDDAPLSLQTLGASVHAAYLPTRHSLISVWDNWEPLLDLMLARL